jgi:hypothetical protein
MSNRNTNLSVRSQTNLQQRTNKKRMKKARRDNRIVRLSEIGRICPSRTIVKLRYMDTTASRTMSSTTGNWAYRSSAFDPDPALGTGAIPGYVEMANLYAEYLVRSMQISVQIMNHETNSVIVSVWPSPNQNSTNSLSYSDILEYGSNVFGVTKVVPQSGNGTIPKIVSFVSGVELIGRQFLTDITYASGSSTNPGNPYWWNVALANPQNTFSFPISYVISIVYEIEFFSRRVLQS